MKKNKFYYLAFLFCALTLGLTSCEKEDDDNGGKSSDLIGYWRFISEEGSIYIDGEVYDEWYEDDEGEIFGVYFDKDGDFYYWEQDYYGIDTEWAGTYSYKNGKLKITEDGETGTANVTTLTSSKLVYEYTESYTEGGAKYKYTVKTTLKKFDVDD